MPTPNAKDARQAIGDEIFPLISAVADNTNKLTYLPAKFKSRSPLICLGKSESERPPLTKLGQRTTFYIPAWLMVLYRDQSSSYDEAAAQNLLDDIETQLADAVLQKRVVENKWKELSTDGRTQVIQPFIVGGDSYILVVVILKMEVF